MPDAVRAVLLEELARGRFGAGLADAPEGVQAHRRSPSCGDEFTVRVVVTGQHREQLDQVLKVFEIIPDHDLAIMQHGQTLTQITTRALDGLDADLQSHAADILLAQGDTTTTFVAALAAFYHNGCQNGAKDAAFKYVTCRASEPSALPT